MPKRRNAKAKNSNEKILIIEKETVITETDESLPINITETEKETTVIDTAHGIQETVIEWEQCAEECTNSSTEKENEETTVFNAVDASYTEETMSEVISDKDTNNASNNSIESTDNKVIKDIEINEDLKHNIDDLNKDKQIIGVMAELSMKEEKKENKEEEKEEEDFIKKEENEVNKEINVAAVATPALNKHSDASFPNAEKEEIMNKEEIETYLSSDDNSKSKEDLSENKTLEKKENKGEVETTNDKMSADDLNKEIMNGFKKEQDQSGNEKTETELLLDNFEEDQTNRSEPGFWESFLDFLCCGTRNMHHH